MSAPEAVIPYERQSDPQTNRTCGAACLSMVYRFFGKEVPQNQIWPSIAKQNRFGSLASTTHLMALDALSRGFGAVAIQARHPLQALRLCRDSGIRAILNHRLKHNAPTGHYTVLVNIDDKNVVLHDPFYGPSRRLSHAELLELWQPHFPSSEIAGYVMIGVAVQPPAAPACQLCRTPIPSSVECPKCKQPVGLHPGALLGCMNSACIARMWNYICCPSCDYTWTFSLQSPQAGATDSGFPGGPSRAGVSGPLSSDAQAAPASEEDPWKLNRLFGELDKFCSHILSLPAAVSHPDIKPQIDFITASKEKLKLAQAEEFAHRKVRQEQLDELAQTAKQKEEAHRKRMEELNTPSPPLDGDALGRALLKNLGLTE
jgi:hypothetical protein